MAARSSRQWKILKAPTKILGRFALDDDDRLDVSTAQQLLHAARADRLQIRSRIRLLAEGIQLGDNGILAAMPQEFVAYKDVESIVCLHEDKRNLALCCRQRRGKFVTVLRFKDVAALDKVFAVIHRQRQAVNGEVAGDIFNRKQQQFVKVTPPEAAQSETVFKSEEAIDSNFVFSSNSVDANNEVDARIDCRQDREGEGRKEEEELGSEWDDLEAYAIFESADGPPTLLNEAVPMHQRANHSSANHSSANHSSANHSSSLPRSS